MFNLDNITKKDDNKDWPYRNLIIGPSESGKQTIKFDPKRQQYHRQNFFICQRFRRTKISVFN